MALTNAEKQARWRERHILKRRNAQRIVNLLVRKHLTAEDAVAAADLLATFFNRAGVRVVRRRLKELTDLPFKEQMARHDAFWKANEQRFLDAWLREHPGRTRAEYNRLLGDHDSEVWEWRRAKGRAANEAERQAWERDHPGEQWQEHQCGMSDREYSDYRRWLRQYERRAHQKRQQNPRQKRRN